jgi:GNAT superfamily N-acetyltransferase
MPVEKFLQEWLGQWPPVEPLTVVGYPPRSEPGWDGAIRDVVGVASPAGAVVSVPPERVDPVRAVAGEWDSLPRVLPAAIGRPRARAYQGTFRWSTAPTELPDVGTWLPFADSRLPHWLRPFGGDVLVVLDGDERYVAGVGLKRHNRFGVELAVGTEPEYRGRGLAARLCAQAARKVLATGAVPLYFHDPENHASARAGAAAGFPDLGWQVLGMTPAPVRALPPT